MKAFCLITLSILLFTSCDSSDSPGLVEKKEYDGNGKIKSIYFVDESSNWQGKCTIYFDNGALKEVRYYEDDLLNGKIQEYYESGSLRSQGVFDKGVQIDTTFFYYENGILDVLSMFDKNGQEVRNISYYENGNTKEERVLMVGDGLISAFKTYNKEGELTSGYKQSKFALFETINRDSISVNLYGVQYENYDSIVVSYVSDFDFQFIEDADILAKELFINEENIVITLNKENYYKGKLSVLLELFTNIELNEVSVQRYYFQFNEGAEIPKNNLYPIYKM